MSGPDLSAEQVIGQALERLAADYDRALADCEYDESVVAVYLPGGWITLARRMIQLIMSEADRRYHALEARAAQLGPVAGIEVCAACTSGVFRVLYDPATTLRQVQCARCGTPSHV